MTRLNRILPIAVGVLAAYELLLGLWMLVSPHTFYDQIAGFGPYPPHFIRDTASWQIALGVTLFAAVSRRSWRAPLLAFAALQCGLHAINHWVDVDNASSLGVVSRLQHTSSRREAADLREPFWQQTPEDE